MASEAGWSPPPETDHPTSRWHDEPAIATGAQRPVNPPCAFADDSPIPAFLIDREASPQLGRRGSCSSPPITCIGRRRAPYRQLEVVPGARRLLATGHVRVLVVTR
jgi:hypothetical protein